MSDPDAGGPGAGDGAASHSPIFRPPPPPLPPPARRAPVEPSGTPTAQHPPVATEPPSPDVAAVEPEPGMPGAHRGGFSRLPTAPVGVAQPADAEGARPLVWAPPAPAAPQRGLAGWALVLAVAGLTFSIFVGWGFPIGLAAIVVAVIALRRPVESRGMATWAICLAALSVLYSAGWLLWAASRAAVLA